MLLSLKLTSSIREFVFFFLQIESEVKFIHSKSQELKCIWTLSQQNVIVSFTRTLMFRIEVIVPEKYLLKGFLEVAYNASIVLKKNLDQRPKIKSLTSCWKDRYRCRALHEKGHFFPGKIDLSIKSDSNLDFQHCDGTYQILFSQYFMPHVFPSDLLQWRILKRGL